MAREFKSNSKPDRRSARRYAIEQALYYKRCGKGWTCEQGKSVDISSGGIKFTTESSLNPGDMIELSMNWPAMLGGGCPLRLQILGYVVRGGPLTAAAKIVRYEFRTSREAADEAAAMLRGQPVEVSFGRRSWLNGPSN